MARLYRRDDTRSIPPAYNGEDSDYRPLRPPQRSHHRPATPYRPGKSLLSNESTRATSVLTTVKQQLGSMIIPPFRSRDSQVEPPVRCSTPKRPALQNRAHIDTRAASMVDLRSVQSSILEHIDGRLEQVLREARNHHATPTFPIELESRLLAIQNDQKNIMDTMSNQIRELQQSNEVLKMELMQMWRIQTPVQPVLVRSAAYKPVVGQPVENAVPVVKRKYVRKIPLVPKKEIEKGLIPSGDEIVPMRTKSALKIKGPPRKSCCAPTPRPRKRKATPAKMTASATPAKLLKESKMSAKDDASIFPVPTATKVENMSESVPISEEANSYKPTCEVEITKAVDLKPIIALPDTPAGLDSCTDTKTVAPQVLVPTMASTKQIRKTRSYRRSSVPRYKPDDVLPTGNVYSRSGRLIRFRQLDGPPPS